MQNAKAKNRRCLRQTLVLSESVFFTTSFFFDACLCCCSFVLHSLFQLYCTVQSSVTRLTLYQPNRPPNLGRPTIAAPLGRCNNIPRSLFCQFHSLVHRSSAGRVWLIQGDHPYHRHHAVSRFVQRGLPLSAECRLGLAQSLWHQASKPAKTRW